ncbi:MAG: hypothetical protein IKG21_10195 [Atopobiaceae bacterium]|nr:hypothetical protein [Atopobiaceae bacterium]
MLKRGITILITAATLLAALVAGVKAEVIRPNMLFVPEGVKGIDASEYQGAIDLATLSDANIEFVYAKATEGASHVDSQFQATCLEAANSRVALGAYHFFSFDSPGTAQAASFVATAARAWNDPVIRSLRPAVDVEWYGDKEQNPPAAEDVRRDLRAFIDAVENACGCKPLIYVGNDMYDRYLKDHFDDCDLWISCRKWPAWVEWPQGEWTIWQYSDVGEVAGAANVAGHVDLNVLNKGLSVEDLLMPQSP